MLRTVVSAVLVTALVVWAGYLCVGCSNAGEHAVPTPGQPGLGDNNIPEGLERTAQWSTVNQVGTYWIGDFVGTDTTSICLDNTQADITMYNQQTRDFGIMQGLNKEISSTNYTAYFMLWYGNETTGALTRQWGNTEKTTASNIDYIHDLAWDKTQGYRFYVTDQELFSASNSYVDCV